MKMQLTPVFGGTVVGTGGIKVVTANGTFTFSLEGADPITVAGDAAIAAETTAVAVARNNPVLTILTLPDLLLQKGKPLSIFDYSTAVVNHEIRLMPFSVGQTVMRQTQWSIASAGALLGSLTLMPASNLLTWYIK